MQPASSTGHDAPRPSRRLVLAATVWTAPVALATAPAPAFAASACAGSVSTMPTSGTSGNGWTRTVTPSGSIKTDDSNNFIDVGSTGGYWIRADPATTGAATIVITTAVAVTAGRNYVFGWYWSKFGGNPRNIVADLVINGMAVVGSHMDTDDAVPDYTTIGRTAPYTATATGSVTVGFQFGIPAGTGTVCDDITVWSLRVVGCA